jgi:ribosome biogenesis protein SSF1/2
MKPLTADKLKERKKAKLKDYIAVAGPLRVSHLLSFSQVKACLMLQIGRMPRGPSLRFEVKKFTLSVDVWKAQSHPSDSLFAYKQSPMVIINNFNEDTHHLKIISLTFQKLFPSINIQTARVNDYRRVLLFNYDKSTDTINMRHYHMKIGPIVGTSCTSQMIKKDVPNLSNAQDISELVFGNYGKGRGPTGNTKTTLCKRKAGDIDHGHNAIKLTELGPRLTLQLLKVEDGIEGGDVLYRLNQNQYK